nr:MAG TPA: hypothetical protein [Caudoviricetes sp.]
MVKIVLYLQLQMRYFCNYKCKYRNIFHNMKLKSS